MDFVTRRKDCSVTRIDISYLKIDMSSDPMLGGEMKRKANGVRTVPQIYVIICAFGWFPRIVCNAAMQQFGKLEKLLKD